MPAPSHAAALDVPAVRAGSGPQPAAGSAARGARPLPASSLKRRLSLLLTSLFCATFLLASMAYVVGVRQDVGSESMAAVRLAEAMLATLPHAAGVPQVPVEVVAQLAGARHIRVAVAADPVAVPHAYPAWFARLFSNDAAPHAVPIVITDQGRAVRAAYLVSTPADELDEKWRYLVSAFWTALVLLVMLNAVAWSIVRWQLLPLQTLRAALDSVGSGARDVRIATSPIEEISAVQHGFNRMAAALRDADVSNRRLTRELLRVQEEERRSIARELHDEFAQQLTAINAESVVIGVALGAEHPALRSLASIRASAQALMRMVRGRLAQLRPEVLDEFGLVAAVEELCDSFQQAHPGIALTRVLPPEIAPGEERSIALFRVLQESLTNVARHASARHVEVRIDRAPAGRGGCVVLRVSDDGIGLRDDPSARTGFGLLGMRERVESLGGHLAFQRAEAGRGLAIVASLPLDDGG